MNSRPIDVLDKAKGKRVILQLKNKAEISGELKAFDMHLNMWLDDVEIQQGDKTTKFGKLLVRGDNITFIAPSD